MSYIKLNGQSFDADVAISAYARNFNVVDGSNAGRTMSGLMTRDIIGTYVGHTITVFRRGNNYAGLDAFWDYLVAHSVDDSVLLEAADGRRQFPIRRITPAARRRSTMCPAASITGARSASALSPSTRG